MSQPLKPMRRPQQPPSPRNREIAKKPTPVVDIFSGAGGLGEGFAAARSGLTRYFDVTLSIDKDGDALKTLAIRKFFNLFDAGQAPEEYYAFLRDDSEKNFQRMRDKFADKWRIAEQRCLELTLGKNLKDESQLDSAIEKAIADSPDRWVLVGGPPCQAYSTAGRARNRSKEGYVPEEDERHFLYAEYLRIIAKYWPSVVIMENVTGILSSKVHNEPVFDKILDDLYDPAKVFQHRSSSPSRTYRYRLYPLARTTSQPGLFGEYLGRKTDFVINCEDFGVPQSRQRVIILAVRDDIQALPERLIPLQGDPIPIGRVLEDLPRLRSGISQGWDSPDAWKKLFEKGRAPRWFSPSDRDARSGFLKILNGTARGSDAERALTARYRKTVDKLKMPLADRGGSFVRRAKAAPNIPQPLRDWIWDSKIRGYSGHMTREHMPSDLYRYFFCAVFAQEFKRAPKLQDFPKELLPAHKNAESGNYVDRFKVQTAERPASTIMSHIKNDGHYYIHPDPTQCRSLTPREAARAQSFPDNYYFSGSMGSKFRQIGNAVPPLLAKQIAGVVAKLIRA